MTISRRLLLAGGGAASAALARPRPARAGFSRSPDVVVFCDPSLRPAFRALGASFRARAGADIRIIAAPARIMQAQLQRGERDDLLVTLVPVLAECETQGLVTRRSDLGVKRTPIVFASARHSPALGADKLRGMLAAGLAAPDPTGNALFDARSVLLGMGVADAAGVHLKGEVDTIGVSYLLRERVVPFGMVLRTDAIANGFAITASVPEAVQLPIEYAVAVSRHVMSRNADAFLALLASGEGRSILASNGLQSVA